MTKVFVVYNLRESGEVKMVKIFAKESDANAYCNKRDKMDLARGIEYAEWYYEVVEVN